MIREWRLRRRMSQLDLALEAGISQRHLSFVETSRALPSREMILLLAEQLGVPLRERNRMLLAAGLAPSFGERSLNDPALQPALAAVETVLRGHEPYPALAVDRHWTMLRANSAIGPLVADVAERSLLEPPVNVLRLSLHPRGLQPRIANFEEWCAHVLARLRHQIDALGDPLLAALEQELMSYAGRCRRHDQPTAAIAVPLRLKASGGILSFISTTTIFGTPLDVTLSELAIESFFPADAETQRALRIAQHAPA
jgi:transcriptional regulator with XRE-family HTH domain